MENKDNALGITTKYIIRKTNEEVEVVAYFQLSNGARSSQDWVTYIDSTGAEHIKENLNMQLDFKLVPELPEFMKKVLDKPSFEYPKFPSAFNIRYYELVKELYLNRNLHLKDAKNMAKKIIDNTKDEFNNEEG